MAVQNKRTRAQIRQSIGYNLGAVEIGTTTDTGSAGQVFDSQNIVFGTTNEMRGKYIVVNDSGDANDGLVRRVLSSDPEQNEINVVPFSGGTDSGIPFEIWDRDMPPARIHDFINRAIESVTRRGVVPSTDSSHHFGGGIRAFTIPTTMVALEQVQFRSKVMSRNIHSMDEAITASDTDVTVVKDDEDYRKGASNRITFATGFGTGEVATDTFAAVDISGMTHIEFWAKSNTTIASTVLDLFLNDTNTEQISISGLDAGEWTFNSAALSNPESDTAITTIGINADADPGTLSFWLDEVKAVREGSEEWEHVHESFWEVDRANRQLVFKPDFRPPYARIKISGYTKPALLTTDSAESDIDAEFIIARATAMALRARADRTATQREAAHLEAERQDALAEIHRNRMQLPRHARWVD